MRPALAPTLAAALAIGAGGCNFAVKHPAVTAGVVAGTMTLGLCELASPEHARCFAAAGVAGAGLALIAAGALWLGTTDEGPAAPPPLEETDLRPRRPAQPRPAAPGPAAPLAASGDGAPPAAAPAAPAAVPPYLARPPELYARRGDAIVPAPAEDQAVAASYARSPVRGPLEAGARLTILTARTTYKVGEEVRVIHVLEAPEPGLELRVMGPKPIYGEYVDGALRTPPEPAAAAPAAPYDGRVAPSPGVDFNYEVTTYRFTTPGPHRIQWRTGGRASNVLELQVTP